TKKAFLLAVAKEGAAGENFDPSLLPASSKDGFLSLHASETRFPSSAPGKCRASRHELSCEDGDFSGPLDVKMP
ncbi:MAG TPA: hypothetical protein VIS99_00130, partial [Terrimicrobiaceae bacterium]